MLDFEHVVKDVMLDNRGRAIRFDALATPHKDYIVYAFLAETRNNSLMQEYFGSETIYKDGDINRYFELCYRNIRGEASTGLEYSQLTSITYFRSKLLEALQEIVEEAAIQILCDYQ